MTEEIHSFVGICISMFVGFLPSSSLFKCVHTASVLAKNNYVMLMTEEIHLNSAFPIRPKPESSGLQVKTKLDVQD